MRALSLAGNLVLVACVAAACSEKTEQRAREAGQETAQAARATGDAVASAAHDAADSVKRAANDPSVKDAEQRAKNAVNETADAASAAAQTAKVKGALVADSSVEARAIDVDTDARTKTITLKGHVRSAAQKTAAGRIATEKASTGYTVRNELDIRP